MEQALAGGSGKLLSERHAASEGVTAHVLIDQQQTKGRMLRGNAGLPRLTRRLRAREV